jgi:hypothetical protein
MEEGGMKTSTKPPTKAERDRMDAIKAYGCIACRSQHGHDWISPCEVHHMLRGNKRIGHHATIGLCPAHHTGLPPFPMTRAERLETIGPCWHKERRAFRERYGSDQYLIDLTSELIGATA